MHSASPVNVYIQNHVKHPVVATNLIDEPVKLPKEKKSLSTTTNKKLVAKSSKDQNKKTNKKNELKSAGTIRKGTARARSLSPKNIKLNDDEFNPNHVKINHHNSSNHLDELLENDLLETKQNNSTKEVYSHKDESLTTLNKFNKALPTPTSSSNAFFSKLLNNQRNKMTLSADQYDPNVNSTFTKINDHNINNLISINITHEDLFNKLVETDIIGTNIAKQLSSLKDFLRLICNVSYILHFRAIIKKFVNIRILKYPSIIFS